MTELTGSRRGRARSQEARRAVLRSTRELVDELGYIHVTIEKIAARAHVGKPTIYRWWQSKNAILAECVLAGEMLPVASPSTTPEGMRESASEWFRASLAYIDENVALLRGLAAAAFEDESIADQLETHLMRPVETALREWVTLADGPEVTWGVARRAEGDVDGIGRERISAAALARLIFGTFLMRLAPGGSIDDGSTEEIFQLAVARLELVETATRPTV